jgi:hypothetical protein
VRVWNNTVARSRNNCCYGNATVHFLCIVDLTADVNNLKLSVWPRKGSNELPLHFVELQNISYCCHQYKWKLDPHVKRPVLFSAINQKGVFQHFTLSNCKNICRVRTALLLLRFWQTDSQPEERTDGENKYDETNRRFLIDFAKFRKGTIDFVTPVSPSICPHGKNSSPNARILIKFDIWVFFQNMPRKFNFH